MPRQPRAVIVVRRELGALRTGANVYLARLFEDLQSQGFRIHLVFAPESTFGNRPLVHVGQAFEELSGAITWPRAIRVGRCFLSLSRRVYGRFLKRVGWEVVRRLRGEAPRVRLARASEPLDPDEVRATARIVDQLSPDLVVAEYSALGPVLAHVNHPGTRKAVLLHDLFSLRAQAMRAVERPADFATFTLEEEAELCEAADELIYASQAERETFRPLLPDREHRWLAPNCTPKVEIAPSGHVRALFMGVRHAGNLDALEYLMEEIWPFVIATKPDAALLIVGEIGASMRPEWRRLAGVKVLGIVEDLTPFGGPDTIGLAPTRVASGISIKIAAYLEMGMTVLASRIALAGYGEELDDRVRIADDAECFAGQLVSLLGLEGIQIPDAPVCDGSRPMPSGDMHQ